MEFVLYSILLAMLLMVLEPCKWRSGGAGSCHVILFRFTQNEVPQRAIKTIERRAVPNELYFEGFDAIPMHVLRARQFGTMVTWIIRLSSFWLFSGHATA